MKGQLSQTKIMIRINLDFLKYTELSIPKNMLVVQNFLKNQYILEQDKPVNHLFVFKSGLAKCFLVAENGKEFIEEFFGTGQIVGEVEIIENTKTFCAVKALTDVQVYKISKENIIELLANDFKFNAMIMKALATKLKDSALRHAHSQIKNIADNLKRLNQDFPDLEQLIPKQELANYLGINIRSLNRVLKESKLKN